MSVVKPEENTEARDAGKLKRAKLSVEAFISSDSLKIFVGLFVLYIVTLKTLQWSDAYPNMLMPVAMIKHGTISFTSLGLFSTKSYLFFRHGGGMYSTFGLGTPLAALPIYLIPTLVIRTMTHYQALIISKVAASAMVALAAVFIYLSARKLSNRPVAVLTALIFGVATNVFAMASQTLMNFTGVVLFSAAGLYFLVSGGDKKRNIILAGVAFAWAGMCQPLLFLILLLFGLFVLVRKWKDVFWYAAGAIPIVLLTVWYQWVSYGSPVKSGELLLSVYNLTGKWNVKVPLTRLWTAQIWKGFAGILFSPSRGVFIWSPILLFSILGFVVTIRRRGNPFLYYCAAAAMLLILAQSAWRWWDGGNGYGYRITLDALPFLVLLLVPAIRFIAKYRSLKVIFAVLLALSVFVQFVGYISYDGGSWECSNVNVTNVNASNIWSLSRNQLVWEVTHFTFYVPYIWRSMIASPIKASIEHTTIKPSKKPGYDDVSFKINASQIGTLQLGIIQEAAERADGTVGIVQTWIQERPFPRGESVVTMPPIKKSRSITKLVCEFDDEWGMESTRTLISLPPI
jgi:hypothetical protein